jgi:putative flippase GtrA
LIVNLIVFTVLQHFTPPAQQKADYNVEFSAAFLAGGLSNYFLNRWWTFRSSGHQGKEALSFMTVSVIALVVGLIVSNALQPLLGHGHKSWFAGTCAGILVNFFVNKYWTFRPAVK